MSNSDRIETPLIGELIAVTDTKGPEEIWHDWELWSRNDQKPPEGDWTTWLMMGGRGAGKTRAGAEWVRALAMNGIGPIALVGETMTEARAVMVEGESGIMRVGPVAERPTFERTRNTLLWPNGVEAEILPAADPERFRGPQFAAAWCDELAKWPHAEKAWDMLQFTLRLGDKPRQMVTTTPRPTKLIKRLLKDPNCVVTRARTEANRKNLAPGFLQAVVGRYQGTVLGRQELDGELIEDAPDALWQRQMLEDLRLAAVPELQRIVVGVDPAVTGTRSADLCGIVVVGKTETGAIVLADRSLPEARPLDWARQVVRAYEMFDADCVVAEVNQGGELVTEMIRQVDPNVPVRAVRATRGKWLRAEPVAALYARGLVQHMGGLSALEDEMCAFGPNGLSDGHSPDRVDALVWALTELMIVTRVEPRVSGWGW